MEKPQSVYPLGLREADRLILLKLDYIIFQNEGLQQMDEATVAALGELKQDIDAIETGIGTLNDEITGDNGALAAKDARIAELEKQVADGFAQDATDKQALADLKAADEAATQALHDTLSPIVAKADGLAAKFQAAVPVVVPDPVDNTVPGNTTPIEDQGSVS